MDSLLDIFPPRTWRWEIPQWPISSAEMPPLNAWEDKESAFVDAELPGVAREDLEVLVKDNELTIKGHRKPDPDEKRTWLRRERATEPFERTITLPWEVNAQKVEAKLANGVLTLRLPKSEQSQTRKVQVQPG